MGDRDSLHRKTVEYNFHIALVGLMRKVAGRKANFSDLFFDTKIWICSILSENLYYHKYWTSVFQKLASKSDLGRKELAPSQASMASF